MSSKDVMWSGTWWPVASTGMSSYLLKLMPVLAVPSIRKILQLVNRSSWRFFKLTKQLQLDAFISRQWNSIIHGSVTAVMIPLAAVAAATVVVLLLWRLLPARIDRLARWLSLSPAIFRLHWRGWLLAESRVRSSGRARKSARSPAVVPIAAAALRVTVLITIVVIIRLLVEIGSSTEIALIIIALIVVVEATIISTKKIRTDEKWGNGWWETCF